MPKEDNNVLKYNHGEKSMKVLFIIYADLESLIEKMSTCQDNPQKLLPPKVDKHTPSGYSLFTKCSFDATKNNLDYHREKDSIKNFCLDIKEHLAKIINYEKKKKWYH